MDSELTRDEFIRWLHFTFLIFMLIGKAGRGRGQVEPESNPARQFNASSLISFLKIALRFYLVDSATLDYRSGKVAGEQLRENGQVSKTEMSLFRFEVRVVFFP